jgi:hypothetical protein
MISKRTRVLHLFLLVCTGITTAFAQNADPAASVVNINAARPLMMAVVELRSRLAIPLNLEDVPLEGPSDLTTVTAKNGKKFVTPRYGQFAMTLPAVGADPYEATKTMIREYESSGLPGEYQVVEHADSIDIIPITRRMADGTIKQVKPILDIQISLPASNAPFYQIFRSIVKQAALASGDQIRVADEPVSMQEVDMPESKSESIRDVFTKLYKAAGMQVSTLLIWEPNTGAYYLSASPFRPPRAVSQRPVLPDPRLNRPTTSGFFTKTP